MIGLVRGRPAAGPGCRPPPALVPSRRRTGVGGRMATERQVQEAVARCVSGLVFYANSGRTRRDKGVMADEARAAARLAASWGLSGRAAEDSFLGPVEAEMVARYGPAG